METATKLHEYFNEYGLLTTCILFIASVLINIGSIIFTARTQEKIKSELSVKTKAQQAIYDDERTAIIQYFDIVINIFDRHLYFPNVVIGQQGIEEYHSSNKDFSEWITKYQIAHARLKLLTFNNDIINESEIIYKELKNLFDYCMKGRSNMFNRINFMVQILNEGKKNEFEKYRVEYKQYDEIQKKEIELFLSDTNILFIKFRDTCKQYLKEKHLNQPNKSAS